MVFLRIILLPFTPLYKYIIWLRNYLFDKKTFKSHKVDARIISIGNLTVGGSGKTPAVIYITNLLKNSDLKIGVLSRGYGRNTKGYRLVSDGEEMKCSVRNCGDEIYITAMECRVPAAVCEKRVEGAERLMQDLKTEVIILDDAFQHRWIYRDVDLLIFDQRFLEKAGGMDQNVLPLGLMREPFKSVQRADAIIVNRKFSEVRPIPVALREYFFEKKIFTAYYKVAGIFDLKNHSYYPVDEFKGQKSLVVSGVARPYSFLNVLKQNNISIKNHLLFEDHKKYSSKEVQRIRKEFYATNSHSVITTEKDAVKLTEFSKELDDIDIFYLKIEIEMDNKEEFQNFIFEKLNKISIQ